MAENPFEDAKREVEAAQRDFRDAVERSQAQLQRTIAQARADVEAARDACEARMKVARERMEAARQMHARQVRPRRPPWRKRPNNDGEPEPMPVRPHNPSPLSGGAEAPADQ